MTKVLQGLVIIAAFVAGLVVGFTFSVYKAVTQKEVSVKVESEETEVEAEVELETQTEIVCNEDWWEKYVIPSEVEEYKVYLELEYAYLHEETNEIYCVELNENNDAGIYFGKDWCPLDYEGMMMWVRLPYQPEEDCMQLFPYKSLIKLACKYSREKNEDLIEEKEPVVTPCYKDDIFSYGWAENNNWYPVETNENNQIGIMYQNKWLPIEKGENNEGEECYGVVFPNGAAEQIFPIEVWQAHSDLV